MPRIAAVLLLAFALSCQAQTNLLADINGDGLADLVRLTNTQVFVQYSNGKGFEPPTYVGDIGHQHCHNESGCAGPSIAVGDVNGDGRADIVSSASTVWLSTPGGFKQTTWPSR